MKISLNEKFYWQNELWWDFFESYVSGSRIQPVNQVKRRLIRLRFYPFYRIHLSCVTESSRTFDFLRSHSSRLRYQTTDIVVKESRSYFNIEIDFLFHILIRKYFLGPTCVGRCLTIFSFLSLLFFVRLCCLREIQKYVLTLHHERLSWVSSIHWCFLHKEATFSTFWRV